MPELLKLEQLQIAFKSHRAWLPAVRGLSFALHAGEAVALVGESGCGKSITALAILGLIAAPQGRVQGSIRFQDRELVGLPESDYRHLRGKEIAMIFQEPMSALNPVFTIETQITDILKRHLRLPRRQARERALELLRLVGIPDAQRRLKQYPHQLSGGMRQRVMIAMALSCQPKLLLADEPTTALDVTIQAQVLEQILELQQKLHMGLLLITHDLGIVAESCQRVLVMYAGRLVEAAPVDRLFRAPQHPYTQGLLAAIPRLQAGKQRLATIPGQVPHLSELGAGCAFAPRCSQAKPHCYQQEAELISIAEQHQVACWHVTG